MRHEGSRPGRTWRILGLLALCVLALRAISCREMAAVPRVVKIGFVGSFEGLYRSNGYDALYAVKLALAEQNARGGIAGHPVELVALDDSGVPEMAALQPAELAADPDILGAVGHTQADTTTAALDAYDAARLPVVVSTAWIRRVDSDWVWLAGASYWQEVGAALAAAGIQPEASVLVLGSDPEWIGQAASQLGDWDVRATTGAAPDIAAETVVLAGRAEQAAGWVAALGTREVAVVGGSDLQSSVFVALAGARAFGVWAGCVAVPRAGDAWEAFRTGYAELAATEPGPLAPLAYDATRALLAAMEQAASEGDLTRQGVARALHSVRQVGLSGEIAFDRNGIRQAVGLTAQHLADVGSGTRGD